MDKGPEWGGWISHLAKGWLNRAAAKPDAKPAEPQKQLAEATIVGQEAAAKFFGPGNPRPGVAPDTGGRIFDYQNQFNITTQPRTNDPKSAGISFEQLRLFGDGCTLLRIIIENRKNAIGTRPFSFRTIDQGDEDAEDPEVQYVSDFFKRPDKNHNFRTWAGMLLEEAFVTDATTVYRRMAADEKTVYSLDPLDGATIKPILDAYGKQPTPPGPAYAQILKGMPARNFTTEEITYWVKSPRVWKVYGMSVVEQVLGIAATAIERDNTRLTKYTDGSWPTAFLKSPEDWPPEKMAAFSGFLNGMLSGNTTQKERIHMVPGDVIEVNPDALKDEFDEWLARIIAFAMGMSPQALVREVNRATAETSRQVSIEEGLEPWMAWFKDLMDHLVQKVMGYPRLEFVWGQDDRSDTLDLAQRDDLEIRAGIKSLDDARIARGRTTTGLGPIMVTTGGQIYSVAALVEAQDGGEPAKPLTAQPPASQPFGGPPAGPEDPMPDETAQRRAPSKKKILMPPRRTGVGIQVAQNAEAKIKDLSKQALDATKAAALAAVMALPDSDFEVERAAKTGSKAATDKILKAVDDNGFAIVEKDVADTMIRLGQIEAQAAVAQLIAATDAKYKKTILAVDEAAAAWAKKRAAELVTEINETTRKDIQAEVVSAFEKGLTRDELVAVVQANQSFSEYRSTLIAQTELSLTTGNAHLMGWEASGVVEGKTWLLSSDHPEEDECDLNAKAGVVPLNQAFPSGDMTNPAHPGCWCTVAAEVGGLD